MRTLLHDLRFALRLLAKNPGFAAAGILSLALGIGANSAIFSVVCGVLLKPLPYEEPERLVLLARTFKGGHGTATTAGAYLFWREHQRFLDSVAAMRGRGAVALEGAGEPARVMQREVSAETFRVLGLQPAAGRFFIDGEDQPRSPDTAILSYELWQRQFGGQRSAIGSDVVLGGRKYTVIGVAPAGLDSMVAADVWSPLKITGNPHRSGYNYVVIGRLKSGITFDAANTQMQVVADRFKWAFPGAVHPTFEGAGVFAYHEEAVGSARPQLLVLLGAVGLVLLIACANLAVLLLARATARRRELAVRMALGAGRARLIRQLLTESILLSLIGGAAGIALSNFTVNAFLRWRPISLPRLDEVSVDLPVVLFTFALALVTGAVFGLAPAVEALRSAPRDGLQETGIQSGTGRRVHALRNVLVVSEFALSIVLLIGALLLVRSFVRLKSVDPGFDPRNVAVASVTITGARYDSAAKVNAFLEQATAAIRELPGVEAVAATTYLPLQGGLNLPLVSIEGRAHPGEGRFLGNLEYFGVSPGFFETIGVALRSGRYLQPTDTAGSPPVIVVNEAFARRHFAVENPVGQRITIMDGQGPHQVAGVVADIRERYLQRPARPAVFVATAQMPAATALSMFPAHVLVRATANPAALAEAIRRQIRRADSLVPIYQVRTLDEIVGDSIKLEQFLMWVLAGFSLLALALAVTGVYGVMSYVVAQRTREMGIRAALGATPADLMRLVLRNALALAALGLAAGAAGAIAGTRLLARFLYDVSPRDVATFVYAAIIIAAAALLASYLPARRAASVQPVTALRSE